MKIDRDVAWDLYTGRDCEGFKHLRATHVDDTRWSSWWQVVVQADDGKFYEFEWETPATEMQEVEHPDEVELVEVRPREVMTIIYERV